MLKKSLNHHKKNALEKIQCVFLVFGHVLFNQTIDCLSILIIFADSQKRIITGKRTNDFRKLRIIEQARQYGCIIGVQCRLNNIDE